MAHITGVTQPGTKADWTRLSPGARQETTEPASQLEPGNENPVTLASSGPSRLNEDTAPLVMTRPAPVAATFEISPASSSPGWDQTLGQALTDIDSPESWSMLARGPGMLAGRENSTQHAESRLQSGQAIDRFQFPEPPNPLGKMSFSATLESGAQITFEVTANQGHGQNRGGSMAYRSIDVSYASDVELTEAEQEALDQFSQNLGQFARDFARNRTPDIALLKLTDSPLLSNIKLSMQIDRDTMALSYQSDADGRQLDLKWNGRSLSMSVAVDALAGGAAADALNDVRRTITESLGKAKASEDDQNVLLQALSLFGGMPDASEAGPSIPEGGEALLTGLPDYNIRFNGVAEAPEELKYNEHFQKYSGVRSFELSQSTKVTEKDGRLLIDQTQLMALDAADFTALPHLELPDFNYENFNWTVIKERHEITTQQVWEDNELASAQMWRSSQSSQITETWSEGEQIDRAANRIDRQQLDDLADWVEARRKDDQGPMSEPDQSAVRVTHQWLH